MKELRGCLREQGDEGVEGCMREQGNQGVYEGMYEGTRG